MKKKIVKTINKTCPSTAQYFGKAGDKPNKLRPMFRYVRDNMGGNLVGVEVGVDRAVNARKVLELLDIKWLYLVDPYTPYENHRTYEEQQRYKKQAKNHLKHYSDRTYWMYYDSLTASQNLQNLFFDFVYIDALHDYTNVLNDCVYWYPLVRKGGVLGGHDFNGSHKELRQAVRDFCSDNGLKLFVKPDDWWIVKEG